MGLLGRWDFRQQAREWAGREAEAQQRWDDHAAPDVTRLDERIAEVSQQLGDVVEERDERDEWRRQHPEAERRLGALNVELSRLEQDRDLVVAEWAVGANDLPALDSVLELEHDEGLDLGL